MEEGQFSSKEERRQNKRKPGVIWGWKNILLIWTHRDKCCFENTARESHGWPSLVCHWCQWLLARTVCRELSESLILLLGTITVIINTGITKKNNKNKQRLENSFCIYWLSDIKRAKLKKKSDINQNKMICIWMTNNHGHTSQCLRFGILLCMLIHVYNDLAGSLVPVILTWVSRLMKQPLSELLLGIKADGKILCK